MPQSHLAGYRLLPPSLVLRGHWDHNGHRSEGQSPDLAGTTTQGRGASLEVPWGGSTSHLLLDSGEVSHSSLIRAASSQKKEKEKIPRNQALRRCVA